MLSTCISFCYWLWDLQFFDHLKQVSINFHNKIWRPAIDSAGEGCCGLTVRRADLRQSAVFAARWWNRTRVVSPGWEADLWAEAPFMGARHRLGKLVDMIESCQLGADRGGDALLYTRLGLCLVFSVDSPRDHNAVFPCSPRPRRLFSDVATGR